jgi:hypothetical protein
MGIHSEKVQENKSQAIVPAASQALKGGADSFQYVDDPSEMVAHSEFQDVVDKSPQVSQLKSIQLMANNSPRVKNITQLQAMADNSFSKQKPIQKIENNTGLPDNLKTGMENLSGTSLDDVKVHRNSDKPAQLQAHAFAQGSDIHLGAGQEKHLPHEAWHVVQQKEGRVKPTMQLMEQNGTPAGKDNAVNINDDAGLEQEADLMGMKALDMPLEQESVFLDSSNNISDTTQLAKIENSTDSDSIDSVEKISVEKIEAEKKVDPKSSAHKERLDVLSKEGQNMGEKAQIELQGELTTTAKLNRFLGNESTYSKLLGKMEAFNKSKEVTAKQSLLKELKPLARTWLEKHAKEISDGKQDANEKLKRESIEKFLNQTTSNYPEVLKKYEDLQISMGKLVADPINNRALFHEAVGDYKILKELVETYKSTYPPSVNLLFIAELDSINATDEGLIKSGEATGPDFDTKLGFSISGNKANFSLDTGKYWLSGSLVISLAGVSSEGTVNVEFNSDGSFSNITVVGESCEFAMDAVEFKMSKFSYDFKNNEFSAEETSGTLNILETSVTLNVTGASIKNGVLDYEKLEGIFTGTLDTKMGIKVVNPTVSYVKGEAIEANGELILAIDNLANATGKVALRVNNKNEIQDITLKDGSSEATLAGLNLNLSGITFDYSAQKFSIEEARGELKIFESDLALTVLGASIEKNIFTYEKIEGELPDIDYGFFSLDKTAIAYSPGSKAFEGKTSYHFNTKESPVGFDNFQTSGEVEIHWNPEGDKYYSINNGELKFNLLGQEVVAKNFNYNSKEQSINADELNLNVVIQDLKKTFTGKAIAINKEGISFEELKTDASGQEFDVKLFSLKPKEYSISKDKDGSFKVNASGSMSLNLPHYLGIKSTGEIEGGVGLSLSKSPEYHITSGTAGIEMPNPLNKISEILGDNWTNSRFELSAAIPVFPAVSAIFGIYIQFGGKLAETLGATIELDDKNNIILTATTNLEASVEGGVFGGIQGGSQLLIALALLLRAAGTFGMNTEVGYSKEFPAEKAPAEGKIKDDSGFTYNIQGEAKVAASLDIVATALYFFQKRFSLTLGEKSLGQFEFSNVKESNPDMGENALADRAMLDEQIDPSLKEEAKKVTLEDLLSLDASHRFAAKDKLEAIDVIKAAEAGRETINQTQNQDPSESKKFNNVPLANLQFYNQFIDKRCNWTEIYSTLDSLGESLKSKQELNGLADKGIAYLQDEILISIQNLGSSSNIAKAFVKHYDEKVNIFAKSYPEAIISPYHSLLSKKGVVLNAVEQMKKNHLHSSFWGDDKKQLENLKTDAWLGMSKYEKFAEAYIAFRKVMMANKNVFEEADKIGKEIAFKLVKDHQRQIESSSK